MSLIAPLNLLFLSLTGAIVLLYMLRLRRKERVVSSTLLWQSALRDLQANAPWQKLRSSLLMWLQIAVLILAAIALARPAIKVRAINGQTVAIVLDASASMGAADVKPSRFGNARSQAEKIISNLGGGDRATIIQCGAQTSVLAPLTSDKGALRRALARADNVDAPSNLREGIVLAASLLRNQKKGNSSSKGQIFLYSDGAVPPLPDLNLQDVGLQFVKVGTGDDNVAITAMDVRRDYAQGANNQIFVNVRNFSAKPRTVNLELTRDGSLVAVQPLQLEGCDRTRSDSGQQSHIFENLPFQDGLFTARFDGADQLACDNIAHAILEKPQKIRVLLISEGNLFLQRALNLDPFVELVQSSKSDFEGGGSQGGYDVVVLDGEAPAKLPVGNQFVFNAVTELSPVEVKGVAENPGVADWDKKHAVTRFEPWNDVRFARSMSATLKPWGVALVEAERTPLVVAGSRRDGGKELRVVWCGFDIRETDLPLRVAFPIFVTNTLHWLAGARQAASATQRKPGDTITLSPPRSVTSISLTGPDKFRASAPAQNGVALFSGAVKTGVYEATAQGWKDRFAVSLLNKSESDIKPSDALKMQAGKPFLGDRSARANRELWTLVALAVLALMVVEWWVYHRGV